MDSIYANTALLLFSHGSVLCGAHRILEEHAHRLRGEQFPIVEYGFLNYSQPSFEEAISRCRAGGAERIIIVPYFLVAGKFVTDDLPPRIDAAKKLYPDLQFTVARALLDEPVLAEAILETEQLADNIENVSEQIPRSACELRSDCPLFETPACPRY